MPKLGNVLVLRMALLRPSPRLNGLLWRLMSTKSFSLFGSVPLPGFFHRSTVFSPSQWFLVPRIDHRTPIQKVDTRMCMLKITNDRVQVVLKLRDTRVDFISTET